jgi:hypothetical protein
MALPLLGLLASQGARAAVTSVIRQGGFTGARAAKQIASKVKKTFDAQKSKAKIPSQSKLTENLTAQEKNILRRTGLLSDTQKTRIPLGGPGPGQTLPGQGRQVILRGRQPSKELIPYNQGVIPKPKPDYLPIPVSNTNFAAGGLGRGQGGYVGPKTFNPLPPTPASYLQTIRQNPIKSGIGLLGTGYLASSFMGEEAPQDTIEPVVTTPVGVQQQEPVSPRFGQIISPSATSTSKEILNAALLRAGLSLLQGGTTRDALTAAATVAESRTKFRTGAEALAAGQRNLGQTADIYVSQNKDGTYTYSGKTSANTSNLLADILSKAKTQGAVITSDVIATAKKQNPNLSDEQIIEGLKQAGYVEQGE